MATAEINLFNYKDFIPASAHYVEPVYTAPKHYEAMKARHRTQSYCSVSATSTSALPMMQRT